MRRYQLIIGILGIVFAAVQVSIHTPNVGPVMGWHVLSSSLFTQSAVPLTSRADLGHCHCDGPLLLCPPSHRRIHHGVNHTPYKTLFLCYVLHNLTPPLTVGFRLWIVCDGTTIAYMLPKIKSVKLSCVAVLWNVMASREAGGSEAIRHSK